MVEEENAQEEKSEESGKPTPVWCVVANVRMSIPYGKGYVETRRGTRKFHGGAKVYLAGAYWGTGAERVIVIGHYRGMGYITCSLDVETLTNWRAELVYSPTVLARLKTTVHAGDSFDWDDSEECKVRAEDRAKSFNRFSDLIFNKRLLKRRLSEELSVSDTGESSP